MGRLESKDDPDSGTLDYDYDQSGSRTAVSSPSGEVSYTYDDLNRLETVVDPQTGTTRYTYDTVGNLKTVSYPNGTVATYEYDLLNRLTLLENRGSDGSLISSYAYTLDASGNRTKVEEEPSGRVVDYVYDSTDRLLSESITEPGKNDRVLSYTYDKVGNRLSKTENGFTTTYMYDDNNRLIKEDDVTYSYDDNGNLIEKESAEEQIVYQYDYDNHLTRVETTRYNATIVVEYEYDADGNRVRKMIDGNVVINYLVDTNRDYAQVVEERDSDGDLLVRYVYGHDLISQTRPSVGSGSVTSYYHYDGLGSTRELSSSAGIVTDSYHYDAFGLLLEQTGTTDNAYRYRGEQFDEELGFYYLRARYMDPNVGRFVTMDEFAGLSQDPVTLHKYLYANANPITYSDPSGYFSLAETQVGQAIQGILQRHNQLMQFARYRMIRGAIVGAVNQMVDKWLGGEDVTFRDLLFGAATGGVLGGAGGAVSYISNRVPPHVLSRLCKLKYLVPIFGAWGLKKEIDGIVESIKKGEYDQAAYRGAQALFSLYEFKKLWKSFACFTEDTLILTKEGYKPIQDVEVNDEVYSMDIEADSAKIVIKRVAKTFTRHTNTLIDLTIQNADSSISVISGTPEHPFFIPSAESYIPMGKLTKGTVLQTKDGTVVTVIKSQIHHGNFTVYNFEVEDTHTYFVSAEKESQWVLVHNACGPKIPRISPAELPEETVSSPDGDTSVISYSYDAVGNRLTKTEDGVTTNYQYDANNRLLQEGQISDHYDDNGKLTEKHGPEEDVLYSYSAENRLTRVETTKHGVTIAVDYEYDADGNRTRKVIDGNVEINYLIDPNRSYAQVLEERDGDGNLLVRYVYGHDLISQTRDNITSYYHCDGLGSTRALSSSAGIVTDEYTYDAFGNLLDKSGVTVNTHLYTGEFFDSHLGFYYLRARYMNPNVGRFVTMDEFAGLNRDPYSLHKYLYAHANPVNMIDPSGHMSSYAEITVAGSIIGTMSGMYIYHVTHAPEERDALGYVTWGAGGSLIGALLAQGAWTLWLSPYLIPPAVDLATNRGINRTAQEVLDLALERGSELVKGFKLLGVKELIGKTFQLDVFYLQRLGGNPRTLIKFLEAEAKASGAQYFRIVGWEIQHPIFQDPKFADFMRKFGYEVTELSNKTLECFKILD